MKIPNYIQEGRRLFCVIGQRVDLYVPRPVIVVDITDGVTEDPYTRRQERIVEVNIHGGGDMEDSSPFSVLSTDLFPTMEQASSQAIRRNRLLTPDFSGMETSVLAYEFFPGEEPRPIISPRDYLIRILEYTPEQADAIIAEGNDPDGNDTYDPYHGVH